MPNLTKCITQATALAKQLFKGKKISNKRIESLAEQINNQARAHQRINPELSDTEAYQRAADMVLNDHTQALDQIDRRLKLQAIRSKQNFEHMERFNWSQKGLQALLDGVENVVTGSRNGLQQLMIGMEQRLLGESDGWLTKLERGQMRKILLDPNNHIQIAQSVMDMMDDKEIPTNVTQPIKDIAKIIVDKNERERRWQNAYGADIPRNKNRIATTRWDRVKMKKIGFDAVYAHDEPLIDWARSFPEIEPEQYKEKFKEFYDEFTTGIRIKNSPESINDVVGFSKFYKALHKRRVFYFKDGAGWIKHQREIGGQDLVQSLVHDTTRTSKNISFLKKLGPYAYEQWDILKNEVNKRGNATPLGLFHLDNIFKDLDGQTSQAVSYTLAHASANLQRGLAWKSLGLVTPRSISDLVNGWMTLRYNGVGLLDRTLATLQTVKNVFKSSAEQKEFLDVVQTGARSIIGSYNRYQAGAVVNGAISKIDKMYYRLNGLQRWDRTLKSSFSHTTARFLAIKRNKTFAHLPEFTKRSLLRNNIGEKEWEVLRNHPVSLPTNKFLIMPESADAITDDEIKTYLGKTKVSADESARTRDELHDRVMMYFIDGERHIIMDSGATERSLLSFGTQRGTVLGEAIRLLTQFKTYPVGFMRRVIGRELSAGLGGKADLAGLMQLVVGTSIFSLLGYSTTELIKGKTPDLTNPRTLVQAIAPSLGIYGDVVRNEMNNYDSGFVKGMLGPVAGTLDDAAKFAGEIATWKRPGMATLNFAKHNLPFLNLWFINLLVHHYLLDTISDNIEPGSVDRTRRYMEKLTGEKDLFNT